MQVLTLEQRRSKDNGKVVKVNTSSMSAFGKAFIDILLVKFQTLLYYFCHPELLDPLPAEPTTLGK